MNELSKIFRHLSRDLFIYFLTGFIVIIDLAYLDYLFCDAKTFKYVKSIPYWTIVSIIIAFAIGHLLFAVMYFVFECSKLESRIKKFFFPLNDENNNAIAFEINFEREITIFANVKELHEQFIERHTQLYLMRWNFSSGLMFSGIINIIFEFYFYYNWGFTFFSIFLILVGFLVYILSLKTEKDCFDRINKISESIT